MDESSEEARRQERRKAKRRQRAEARRWRRKEWERHIFWRWFALACLVVFTVLSLLLIIPGLFDLGPLARSGARERNAAQAQELRITASADRARLVDDSIQAASVLASTLAPAALQASAAGHDLLRQGGDLTGQFLKEVGFPLGKDAAKTVGQAIWHRYVKNPKSPSAPVVPVVVPGTGGRVSSTINLTIVIREGRRPQVITKVVRIPDDPG